MTKFIVTHGIRIAKDFVPETFGRLTTIGPVFTATVGHQRKSLQVCACSCGEVVCVLTNHLRRKATRSCGCFKVEKATIGATKHNMYWDANYKAYYGMLARCYNPNNQDYANYGGRGIGVWDTWRGPGGFELWFAEIGPKPSKHHSQDRFPNRDGNYEPGNIRWATQSEQMNNTRCTIHLEIDGVVRPLTEWARSIGIKPSVVRYRVHKGWCHYDALHTPIRHKSSWETA